MMANRWLFLFLWTAGSTGSWLHVSGQGWVTAGCTTALIVSPMGQSVPQRLSSHLASVRDHTLVCEQ